MEKLAEIMQDLERKGAAIGITLQTLRELYGLPEHEVAVLRSLNEPPVPAKRLKAGTTAGDKLLCANPDCGKPFEPHFKSGPRQSHVCPKATCKKWWSAQRLAQRQAAKEQKPRGRRSLHDGKPKVQSPIPDEQEPEPRPKLRVSPDDALQLYAKAHGGRLFLDNKMAAFFRVEGVFDGSDRAIWNKAREVLEASAYFEFNTADGSWVLLE